MDSPNNWALVDAITTFETPEDKERKRSIVVVGLPEPESGDSIERADADSNTVVTMLRTLNVQSRPDKVYRLGRPRNKNDAAKGPRLVKVVMPSSQFQRHVLSSLRDHRQALRALPGFQRAFIRPHQQSSSKTVSSVTA
jgi:hypothetical protein